MSIRPGFKILLAAAAVLLWLQPLAWAADHRDAPTVDQYSAIDINDIFMFRDPPCTTANCTSTNLVLALSTQAVADPKFGASYHFQANALYRFYFSTTPNAITKGIPTTSIDFVFSPFGNNPSCPAPGPLCQTYTAVFPNGIVVKGLTTQGTAAATPLPPVTCPATPTLGNSPTNGCIGAPGPGITVFAGPREDPFFFDLVGFDRFLADVNGQTATPVKPNFNLFTGVDSFLGKNVNAIVIKFPINLVAGAATKFSAWAVTYLGDLPPSDASDDKDFERHFAEYFERHPEGLRQIDRMGNPGVNTVLITPPLKDAFNFGVPEDDAQDFAPTIVASLTKYGVAADPSSAPVVQALATAAIPDTLKFDVTLPDGYVQVPPNGRQLGDRTTDFLLSLFFDVFNQRVGSLGPEAPCAIAVTAFSDCTAPKTYLATFPYLGPPLQQTP